MALRNGLNDIYSLVMGVIAATFGNLIADIVCSAIPILLKKGELYATACAVGGSVYLLLRYVSLEDNTNLVVYAVVVVAIRIYLKSKRLR